MANGVPLRVRHVGLGLDTDLISAEVYDGEVVLSGADALFVGQRYLVYAPDTLRSTAASAEVTIIHGQQVLELKLMRPARRIERCARATISAAIGGARRSPTLGTRRSARRQPNQNHRGWHNHHDSGLAGAATPAVGLP